jgi:phosphopentomutase
LTKLTDLQKKKIIADYIETQNYLETARKNGVSDVTVKTIVKKDITTTELLKQKKIENTQSTIQYMQTQHESKKRILDKILKAIEEKADNIDMFTNIKDLATAYGIILDKELKVLEIQRNYTNTEEINKVRELLTKISDGANNG